jgi:anti-sigma regulatory factor (Ser/Thr protein kinase)
MSKMEPQTERSAPQRPAALKLRVTSDPAFLSPVRRCVEHFCVEAGLDDKAVAELGLCVNEAMANVTRHVYDGAIDKPVEVDADFDGEAVRIRVRDWGPGREPPTEPKHDPLKPGGIGLVCLKSLLDDFEFKKLPDGMRLTMKRNLNHGRAS